MRRTKGFTLMEVMATMAVLCIIMAILVPAGGAWLTDYQFNSLGRSFAHAALTSRMQALENKAVFRVYAASFSGLNMRFSTKDPLLSPSDTVKLEALKHRFQKPLGNKRGDYVMFAGLDYACNLSGGEFEVLQIVDPWTFEVESGGGPLPTFNQSVTVPTVRNLSACGRFMVLPAVRPTIPPTVGVEEFAFDSKGYSVSQEGYAVVFRYDYDRFEVFFDDPGLANPLNARTGTEFGASPPNAAPFRFVEVRFDSRGLPEDLTPHTFVVREKVNAAGGHKAARSLEYTITSTGRVSGAYDKTK